MRYPIYINEADALGFKCDVLVLKYARRLYGVDKLLFNALFGINASAEKMLPTPDKHLCIITNGKVAASTVIFVGTDSLADLTYDHIRSFAKRALEICAIETPEARIIALTIHGANIGLDEGEALYSEIFGLNEAISNQTYPQNLESITIVERDPGRVNRLREALERMARIGEDGPLATIMQNDGSPSFRRSTNLIAFEGTPQSASRSRRPGAMPSIFVAMPFVEEMDDIFFYGIQKPVEECGHLCERADLASFTGDVMNWVKEKISSAEIIIADLTNANPNVYLEVGYAWGIGKKTVLLARKGSELKFDVRSQRCLFYNSIRELEEQLNKEFQTLLPSMTLWRP